MNGRQGGSVSISAAVRDAASLTVGLVSLGVQAVDHAFREGTGPAASRPPGQIPQQRVAADAAALVDTVLGGAMVTARWTVRVVSGAAQTAHILTRPVTKHLIPDGLLNIPRLRAVTDLGHRERLLAEREAGVLTRRLLGQLVVLVLDQLDLTHEVLERVDLDAVVKSVDLDAAVRQVDLDAIVDQVNLDRAVRRVDLDAIIDRLDLNRAIRRVDVDAVVASADIDKVIDRIDLVGLAAEIVAALDLPDIIRGSSGSLATEMVRDARVQSMAADEAVSRIVDRLLLRRRARIQPDEPAG